MTIFGMTIQDIATLITILLLCYLIPLRKLSESNGDKSDKKRIRLRYSLLTLVAFLVIGYSDLGSRSVDGLVSAKSLVAVLIKYVLIWLSGTFIFISFAFWMSSRKRS